MFTTFRTPKPSIDVADAKPVSLRQTEAHPLDALTGGAFSAPTSGERAARIREWLASEPSADKMQDVFRELSVKDKGAARPLRERLDEIKRSKVQEAMAADWAQRGQTLLAQAKLNIADALAWQRDAARAGAPLSREPLAAVRLQLSERIKGIEDLQNRIQVQREAAVLLAQRIEVLSTKSWLDAQAALDVLVADVQHWQNQAGELTGDANWPSVDLRITPQLEASRSQLLLVWEAFQAALLQAQAAATDTSAPLPPVPMWADELRLLRGIEIETEAAPGKPRIDPEVMREMRDKAALVVREALSKLEQEVTLGHGRASANAAAGLRNALKEHTRLIDSALEGQAHAVLAAAGELEGWQRWRADQLREELVQKAEALLNRPEGQALGGRKMQETLRSLRDQWKQTDQGGIPNHALWKRFDEACTQAHKVVELWLEQQKAEATLHRTQRLALLDEIQAWAAANASAGSDPANDGQRPDWKQFSRALHQFGDRWREAGHMNEKTFAELQPLWKAAIGAAAAPLEAVQQRSVELRQAMIEQARELGALAVLPIDAVKALQQRWQAEAQSVPLDRKFEQKLWDAFRKPIDQAFERKTQEREKSAAALSAHERGVLQATQALDAASASADAQQIRAALTALEAALHAVPTTPAAEPVVPVVAVASAQQMATDSPASAASAEPEAASEPAASSNDPAAEQATTAATTDAALPPKALPKPVVARRGDDRPGSRLTEPVRPSRPGERRDGARDSSRSRDGAREAGREAVRSGPRDAAAAGRWPERPEAPRPPRLGDVAFRAQREARERADLALRKLASQAHGETVTRLLSAWQQREAAQLPSLHELGNVNQAVRNAWVLALRSSASTDAASESSLLRLEMAAEVPTPAEQLPMRRLLQLQLLTQRHDPGPAQTWGQDLARLLSGPFDEALARRLQGVLKVLLRR